MEVKIHERARPDFSRWRYSLSAIRTVRSTMAKQMWEEFRASIMQANGPPAGSIPIPELGQDYWLCPYPPCYMSLVWFRMVSNFLGLWPTRVAIVMDFNFSPGLPGPTPEDTHPDQK